MLPSPLLAPRVCSSFLASVISLCIADGAAWSVLVATEQASGNSNAMKRTEAGPDTSRRSSSLRSGSANFGRIVVRGPSSTGVLEH